MSRLATALNIVATIPFIIGGPWVVALSGGDAFPLVLGALLFAIGAYLAVRVLFLRIRYDTGSVQVSGVLRSTTIPRYSITAVSTNIERPSITWHTDSGRRVETVLEVVRFSSSGLTSLAARKARTGFLSALALWADGKDPVEAQADGEHSAAVSPRRNWRSRHPSEVRRSDAVWDIAMWISPIVALTGIFSALGLSRRSPPMPIETSAVLVTVGAAIIVVLLLATGVRRLSGSSPDRYPRLTLATTGLATLAAAAIIWVRDGAEVTQTSIWPIIVCCTAALLALVILATAPKRR